MHVITVILHHFQNLTAKAEEDRETLESAKLALEQVEDYKKIEVR